MQIFVPNTPEGFEWAQPVDHDFFEMLQTFATEPGVNLDEMEMVLLKENDRGRRQRRSDMPFLGTDVLVLRDDAIECVGSLLKPYGEVVLVRSADARLAVFGARAHKGVISLEKSGVVRFSSGRIMRLNPPVFNPEVSAELGAFKLTEMPHGDLYLTGDLVDKILATGLTSGTEFELVWES